MSCGRGRSRIGGSRRSAPGRPAAGGRQGGTGPSLAVINRISPLGNQVCFTYNSIVTSTYYDAGHLGERLLRHEDKAQQEYLDYIRNLSHDLRSDISSPWSQLAASTERSKLEPELRNEAWRASLRYVAISMVDRELDVWSSLNPDGLKFTIHGKAGEIQFRPTSSEFLSMTAQHCVGGIKRSSKGTKVTYAYRLERESENEIPVRFAVPLQDEISGAIIDASVQTMIESNQPICYLATGIDDLNSALRDYFQHG